MDEEAMTEGACQRLPGVPWRRPELYLGLAVRPGISNFGERDELDIGYRLVVSRPT
jgi:hypothetical protein